MSPTALDQDIDAKPTQAIDLGRGPLVLLFYDGFERKALPGFVGRLYSDSREAARKLYRTAKGLQSDTGFYVAFKLMVDSLRRAGCDVRINDFALAAAHPTYPIGIAGYPSVLDKVQLPNPAIFGPGDYGLPDELDLTRTRPNVQRYIQPCRWATSLYDATLGDKTMVWPVGIDTDKYVDQSAHAKDLDFVVYDKIRWHRDREVPRILDRILAHAAASGKSFEVLRYGHHVHADYMSGLKRARAMLFVCEHETQGLACQEALSCNVPVLAWDEGTLVDAAQARFLPDGMRVSSVPYFDARCGETFEIENFEAAHDTFWQRYDTYQPRAFVLDTLSMPKSAAAYLKAYFELA